MKKYTSVIGIIFFLAISSNVFAQVEDEFESYKKRSNNVDVIEEEFNIIKIDYDQKNQFTGSLGSLFLVVNSTMFTYRRSIFYRSSFDIGIALSLGGHSIKESTYDFKFDTYRYTFILPSLSFVYGNYHCFEIDVGAEYFLNFKNASSGISSQPSGLDLLSSNVVLIPYVNMFYVRKSYTSPFDFKIGAGFPFFAHLGLGVRF